MKRPIYKYVWATCLIMLSHGMHRANRQTIEERLRMIMADFETVGLSVVVVQDDQIVYNQSLGLKDQENNIPLGQDDLFRIASISKSFSVVAIMQLIEAGKVTLDTDVNELVPFRVRNPRFPEVPITLRMLLT